MNLIVVDKCTNYCGYCFAATEMGKTHSKASLSREAVDEVVDFVGRSGPGFELNIIGGEPFLYLDLPFLVDRLYSEPSFGSATIFTGGIFQSGRLADLRTHAHKLTLLVNLNERRDYKTEAEYALVLRNISEAQALGVRVIIGYNVWRIDFDYDEILDVCEEYGVEQLRWTVAYPELLPSPGVTTLAPKDYSAAAKRCAAFLEAAYRRKIEAYLDCPLPKCFFSAEELGRIAMTQPRSVSAIRSCGPVIDVSPDLSVFRCFALSSVKRRRLTEFRSYAEVVSWYEREIDARYAAPTVFPTCKTCEFAIDRSCYGGCMAHNASSLGRRKTTTERLEATHAALVKGDFETARNEIGEISDRSAPVAMLWSHLCKAEGDQAGAERWARTAVNRSRTEKTRTEARRLLSSVVALLPPRGKRTEGLVVE